MRRRRLTATLRLLSAALLIMVAWAAVALLSVRGDLETARDALEQVRAADDLEATGAPLAEAETSLTRALGRLHQPGPAVTGALPLLGRTVRTVERSTAAALAVTRGGRDILAAVDADRPLLVDGAVDTPRLLAVRKALDRAARSADGPVRRLRQQPLATVPGVVAGPARELRSELGPIPEDLRGAAAGLGALVDVLGGSAPRSLLLLLENNAELRGTGGIVTVFARARTEHGKIALEEFRDVEDVADPAAEARPVPAPDDYVALYGSFKAASTLWKNANMSPDVPTSSTVLASIAEASTGRRPDAVLWLDVPAIAAVLRATGPARLPSGQQLSADQAVPELLSRAYSSADDTLDGQAQRRAALRGAADAVLRGLLGPGPAAASPVALARELSAAARGRHLALWAAEPDVQAGLVRAGLAGEVTANGGDLSALTVHNLGGGDANGNKLDYYGRRQTTVRVRLGREAAAVEQELALRNNAPAAGLPRYVAGTGTPGTTNSFVTLAVPRGAVDVTVTRDGRSLPAARRREGDHDVVTDLVSLPPGGSVVWRLRYRLSLHGSYAMTLYPQPLAVDSGLAVDLSPDPGVVLTSPDGDRLGADDLSRSQAYDSVVRLTARPARPGMLRRALDTLRRFWNEPVRLP